MKIGKEPGDLWGNFNILCLAILSPSYCHVYQRSPAYCQEGLESADKYKWWQELGDLKLQARSVLCPPPAINVTDPSVKSLHPYTFQAGMFVFLVDSLEFLLTLYSISSTLVLNKEKIGGKSYLNKLLSVENCYSKGNWTHCLCYWSLLRAYKKIILTASVFPKDRENTNSLHYS